VEALCFSRGELDFSPAEGDLNKNGLLALAFPRPALKRMINLELFPENAEALLPSAEAEGWSFYISVARWIVFQPGKLLCLLCFGFVSGHDFSRAAQNK
jgi:hypothetical protein